MLDRRLRLDDYPEKDHIHDATNAYAMTTRGETIRVSLCAAPPPAPSRLLVSWTGCKHLSAEEAGWDRPSFQFMAAHGSSILLSLRRHYCSSELFLYTAGPPTLRVLPLPSFESRSYSDRDTGLCTMFTRDKVALLCHGDEGEFVVAELKISRKDKYLYISSAYDDDDTPLEAGLCVFRSCSPGDNWKATSLQVRHKKGQGKELRWWATQEVVSFGGSLCYVDYSRGVLFLDVLRECPELRYVRLPVTMPSSDLENYDCHSKFSERSRCLCVTDGGHTMKFVDVVTTTVFVSCRGATASALFTINVWRLRRKGKSMTWEKESDMEDADLWTQPGYNHLPRVAPTFPRVSVAEPNLVYFMLSHKRRVDDEDETWVIMVDTLDKTLRSSFRYTNNSGSLPIHRALIPCEFSKYLHVLESS
jgi:hypothetical protein